METKKVWFVTGASKGLGLALVESLLANGYKVAATSRNVETLKKEVCGNENFLGLEMDVVDTTSVSDAIAQAIAHFKAIDVVVNNAGYGQLGTLEELSDGEARGNFDANVFGMLNVIRAVVPHLRNRRAGHIINISSIAGFLGTFPGWGVYNATKFAVAGLTEAFSAEVKPFGINATIVYPGYFRTNFLLKDSLRLAENQVAEYTEVREGERAHIEDIPGNQPGNPEKAANALIQLAESQNPPLHFFMGSDSFELASHKVQVLQKEIADNEALSKSTNY